MRWGSAFADERIAQVNLKIKTFLRKRKYDKFGLNEIEIADDCRLRASTSQTTDGENCMGGSMVTYLSAATSFLNNMN